MLRNMSLTWSLLRKVAKELRYRPLLDLIGQEVEIKSLGTVENDIRLTIGVSLPSECVMSSPLSELALVRYGILDLYFEAPRSMLANNYQSGIPLLKELGFAVEPEHAQELIETRRGLGDKFADDPTCLNELANDLAENRTLLKLFLRGESGILRYLRQLPEEIRDQESMKIPENFELPANYFPHSFLLTDACVTNANFVWFHTHFYF